MAKQKKKAGTAAGAYVRDEIEAIRRGEHGAANAKQAIAIGLSKARRAGVKVGKNPHRKKKKTTTKRKPSSESRAKRSRASRAALEKQPRAAAGKKALSRHARAVARRKK